MSIKTTLFSSLVLVLGLLMSFNYVYKQLTVPWVQFLFQSDFISILEKSELDQKKLASLDPEREAEYRQRFGFISDIRSHLQVLEHNQKNLEQTLNRAYMIVLTCIFSLAIGAYLLHQNYVKNNLETLKVLIGQLLEEQETQGSSVKGVFKKMEIMVRDAASLLMAKNNKIKTLDHLSNWQESARRHAHEIKTPLTATRLELESLERTLYPHLSEEALEIWHRAKENMMKELDRLKEFTVGFSSFGKINKPNLQKMDLVKTLQEFTEIYANAWPELEFELIVREELILVLADRDLLRQVWVNLAQNSVHALTENNLGRGKARFSLKRIPDGVQVIYQDNGPGVPENIANKIFEPYVTSKAIGQGMGLGMAISKKIMLDHGGDLELMQDHGVGACFVLTLPDEMEYMDA